MSPSAPDISALDAMSSDELLALFRTLSSPGIHEMQGEYKARLLAQVSPWMNKIGTGTLYNPVIGNWQCKAFRPVDDTAGRGYNSFKHRGQIVQRYPMKTIIAPSRYDGKPAYTLIYRAYHSACANIHMVDEVRRLDAEHFLGMGTFGFSEKQRRMPMPFLLRGPVDEYRRDIGRERTGFRDDSELVAYA